MQNKKDYKWFKYGSLAIILIVIIVTIIYLFSKNPNLLEDLIAQYGFFGLFIVAIAVNATVLFPLPLFDLAILAVAAASPDFITPFVIGVVVGVGAAIGEMSAFMVGLLGMKAAEEATGKKFEKLNRIQEIIKKGGMFVIYVGAIIPFPFDLVAIAAGLLKFNPGKFFIAALFGKMTRFIIFSYAGYLGITAVKTFFGV